jgi:hypothetical protein
MHGTSSKYGIPSNHILRWHLVEHSPSILYASTLCINVNQATPHKDIRLQTALNDLLMNTPALFNCNHSTFSNLEDVQCMGMVRKLLKILNGEGVQPNDISFVCLLSACSHAILVDEGMHCYASMITDYMVSAKLEHFTCMVDLLGCAGAYKRPRI